MGKPKPPGGSCWFFFLEAGTFSSPSGGVDLFGLFREGKIGDNEGLRCDYCLRARSWRTPSFFGATRRGLSGIDSWRGTLYKRGN